MSELYFAYGSNMSSARLHARIEGAQALGAARLAGFELVFDKPGNDGTAKANLRPVPGATAHGVLWRIESTALHVLDTFEPGYARERRSVMPVAHASGAIEHAAWIYLHPGAELDLSPSAGYVRHLLEGAREHGLPEELQRTLQDMMESLAAR